MAAAAGSLFAYEVKDSEQSSIATLIDSWSITAQKLFKETKADAFGDSHTVLRKMQAEFSLGRLRACEGYERSLVVCTDCDGRVHAIAMANFASFAEIDFLATNPINIRHPCNDGKEGRVRGAATTVVQHVAKKTLSTKEQKIQLDSYEYARTFYMDRLGFIERYGMTFSVGDIYYELPPERVKTLADTRFTFVCEAPDEGVSLLIPKIPKSVEEE